MTHTRSRMRASRFDGESFILAVECADTAMSVWDVRSTVLPYDVGAVIRRQVTIPIALPAARTATETERVLTPPERTST